MTSGGPECTGWRTGTGIPSLYSCIRDLDAPSLKRIAARWLGSESARYRKHDCIYALGKALEDARILESLAAGLSDAERAALGLLKLYGGTSPEVELTGGLMMLGRPFPPPNAALAPYAYSDFRYGNRDTSVESLLGAGLAGRYDADWWMRQITNPYGLARVPGAIPTVTSDARLMAHVEPMPPATLELEPAAPEGRGVFLRPAQVALRFVELMAAMRRLGPAELTTSGRPKKTYVNKLGKILNWDAAMKADSAAPIPEATFMMWRLLFGAGLVVLSDDERFVDLTPASESLLDRSSSELAAAAADGYRSLTGWAETRPQGFWMSERELYGPSAFNAMRAALLVALAALPEPRVWYSVESLSRAMFNRLDYRLALGPVPAMAWAWRADEREVLRLKWRVARREQWEVSEQAWLGRAIAGPLYHLGLVELAQADGSGGPWSLFRLTEVGAAALYERYRPGGTASLTGAPASRPAASDAWVVQPNFDVIAYLDRATAPQLGFLTRIGDRRPGEGGAAVYRLSRDSVYRGLEDGLTTAEILERLQSGSAVPIPETVRRSVEDWSTRRERLSVHLAAAMLEFPDSASRDRAIEEGLYPGGVPVGERVLFLREAGLNAKAMRSVGRVVDYRQKPAECLTFSEDGIVRLDPSRADLAVRGQVSAWAEPLEGEEDVWKITRRSIQAALAKGWTAVGIEGAVSSRSLGSPPPLLIEAIRAWATKRGASGGAAVSTQPILQVRDGDLANAVAGSRLLAPYVRARLGPNTFLVRPGKEEELTETLEELGIEMCADLGNLP